MTAASTLALLKDDFEHTSWEEGEEGRCMSWHGALAKHTATKARAAEAKAVGRFAE